MSLSRRCLKNAITPPPRVTAPPIIAISRWVRMLWVSIFACPSFLLRCGRLWACQSWAAVALDALVFSVDGLTLGRVSARCDCSGTDANDHGRQRAHARQPFDLPREHRHGDRARKTTED